MSRIIPILSRKTVERKYLEIVTHDGKFHLDELLAIVLVKMAARLFNVDIHVQRTRDPEVFEKADLVLDVGGFNSGKYMDHHGHMFNEFHKEAPQIKLATAGIVWLDLRDHLLYSILKKHHDNPLIENIVSDYILRKLIIPSDMEDNGLGRSYPGTPMSINEIVSSFNTSIENEDESNLQFTKALRMVEMIVDNKIREIVHIAVEDEKIYQKILTAPADEKADGLLVMKEYMAWNASVRRHWDDTLHLKLAIYPDGRAPDVWRIQTMPGDKYDKFAQRCCAPAHLHGYSQSRAADFRNVGVYAGNIIFVHPNGHLGGIRGTLEDAKAFARYWIKHSANTIDPQPVGLSWNTDQQFPHARIIATPVDA